MAASLEAHLNNKIDDLAQFFCQLYHVSCNQNVRGRAMVVGPDPNGLAADAVLVNVMNLDVLSARMTLLQMGAQLPGTHCRYILRLGTPTARSDKHGVARDCLHLSVSLQAPVHKEGDASCSLAEHYGRLRAERMAEGAREKVLRIVDIPVAGIAPSQVRMLQDIERLVVYFFRDLPLSYDAAYVSREKRHMLEFRGLSVVPQELVDAILALAIDDVVFVFDRRVMQVFFVPQIGAGSEVAAAAAAAHDAPSKDEPAPRGWGWGFIGWLTGRREPEPVAGKKRKRGSESEDDQEGDNGDQSDEEPRVQVPKPATKRARVE